MRQFIEWHEIDEMDGEPYGRRLMPVDRIACVYERKGRTRVTYDDGEYGLTTDVVSESFDEIKQKIEDSKVDGSWWLKGAQRERWADHEDNIAFREEVRRS